MEIIDIFVLLVLLGLFIYVLTSRELFSFGVGGYEIINLSMHHLALFRQEIGSLSPFTCPENKPDLDGGLCYVKCRASYHGVGPVCWADTENIGVGTPVGLEPCPDGWNNDGLTCREPISCKSIGDCFSGRGCGCSGGNIKGRLDNGGVCPGPGGDDYKDKVDGLCYKTCPKHMPKHLPLMPYLCYAGGDLSYGRGVGQVPSMVRVLGKYTFF